ncbi:MAG: DUF1064 domain-containing protein [Chloroflexota bacterium]|nr:DUF1064 domain-containing protein [Chloroflexota bacterium]
MPRNKYNARKVTIDGIEFDSKAEGRRYMFLKSEQQAGRISDLECHPRFRLMDAYRWNGKTYKSVNFTPDFQYQQGGKTVCEDVKGGPTRTTAFTLRLKMWIRQHPEDEWDFKVVQA